MSDFLFSTRSVPEGELTRLLAARLGPVSSSILEWRGAWGTVAVAACAHDPAVVREDEQALTVLLGWPVLRAAGFAPAPVLDEARRAAAHRLLREGDAVPESLDGPFAALCVDKRAGRSTVWTDRMGFIPLFVSTPAGEGTGLVVGSHVDAVAEAAGRLGAVDLVSATDFAVHSSITYPATLYRGVEQFPPAARRSCVAGGGWSEPERVYWFPTEQSRFRTHGQAARALRTAFAAAVREGCEGLDRVGLLLSGGEDSRAVLGAVPPGVRVDAFIYGDWENREVRIARRVARIYGAQLHFGLRDPDHYLQLEEVARVVGTQHRYSDAHGYALRERLGLAGLPLVLGGYLSDSLLKANYAHPPKKRLIRRATPLPGETEPPIIANVPGVREELLREVELRRARHLERVRELRPRSAEEWLVLWPFSMRATSSNLHGNRRLFRAFEPFLSNSILEIARAVPQWWKRERLLFHRAMRPFLARSWYVPHGRSKFPYFGPLANVPLGLGLKWARSVRDRAAGEAGLVQGPWPELSDLVGSPAMRRKLEQHPVWDSPLREIFAPLPPAGPALDDLRRRWTPEQQLGLLQLVHLLREQAAR